MRSRGRLRSRTEASGQKRPQKSRCGRPEARRLLLLHAEQPIYWCARQPLSGESMIPPRKTRTIRIRDLEVGGAAPIAVQSMAATRTRDLEATAQQIRILEAAGADLIRIAVDSKEDVAALGKLREKTNARLSVDLQESYRLAETVAPFVDKIRYNPGHLHHHEKSKSVQEKVAFLVGIAQKHACALRIGINAGSIAPEYDARFPDDHASAIIACAIDHCAMVDALGFSDYVVSIKDSDPRLVIDANARL